MSDIAIKVENLSKRYVLNHQRAAGDGLRHVIQDKLTAPFRWLGGKIRGQKSEASPASASSSTSAFLPSPSALRPPTSEEFYALRDVSFEVKRGEVVGIIGRNGAGKSTLLKILSRITEPTSGRITIEGRVASLLEVGTGFHPELTGRENIFLNGAILGMSRSEIKRKFDEIVAFAEIEKFLDTPVKRYSSGMYVRLAFSVAAHLEPEILIVDEVLAVGDAQFQRKCMGKMQDVAESGGRAVLFVSHNMGSIQRLCTQAILLKQGRLERVGKPDDLVEAYLSAGTDTQSARDLTLIDTASRRGTGRARFSKIELLRINGEAASEIKQAEPLRVRLSIISESCTEVVALGFSFISSDGTEVMGTCAHDGGFTGSLTIGPQSFTCTVDPMILAPGTFYIRAAIFTPSEVLDYIDELIAFEVSNASDNPTRTPIGHRVGYVYLPFNWKKTDDFE